MNKSLKKKGAAIGLKMASSISHQKSRVTDLAPELTAKQEGCIEVFLGGAKEKEEG